MLCIDVVHHIHVKSGIEGKRGSVFAIGGKTLVHQLLHALPVAYHKAVQAPAVLEDLSECIVVGSSGNAAYVVERTHDGGAAGVYSRLEWRQIGVPKSLAGDFSIHVITSCLRGTVAHIMLEACSHCPWI